MQKTISKPIFLVTQEAINITIYSFNVIESLKLLHQIILHFIWLQYTKHIYV